MLDLYKNIKKLRQEAGMTQSDLALKCGYSDKSMIAKIEAGRIDLSRNKIEIFAEALRTTPAVLMGWEPPQNSPFGAYRIPVVATVAAGEPIYSDEQVIEWIDYHKAPTDGVLAVKIQGDSMMPRIHDGDLIIVEQSVGWDDGDIVLVTVNGNDGTCKRIKKYQGGISLISLNPAYEPMYYSNEEVQTLPIRVVGKVVEVRGRF